MQQKKEVLCRRITFFEVVLLLVGCALAVVGFYFIYQTYLVQPGFTYPFLQTVFLWLVLFVMFIIAALLVDVKEELAGVMRGVYEETKVLQEIHKEHLQEMKLQSILSRKKR